MKILSCLALVLLSIAGYFIIDRSDHPHKLSNPTPFDQFLGINSVRESQLDVIQDQFQVARFHRIFGMDSYMFTGTEFVINSSGNKREVDLSIPHDEYPNDKIGFNPSKTADFNFDRFLTAMKGNGLISIPVLARNLLYSNVPENNIINVWQIPWDDGGDPENPMDYKAYSSFLYQFTARYGKNKLSGAGGTINPQTLKIAPDNEVKAGLNLVYAIEPGNEMDKDWFSNREEASTKELAAFMSAVIDGHMGLMGEGHGILSADPSMKIVFPSPADIKSDYVFDVLDELKLLRKDAPKYGRKIIPEENLILTAHFYPFKRSLIPGSRTSDIAENTELIERSRDFIDKVKANYNCPVYMTETGYDKVVRGSSDIGVPAIGSDRMDTEIISTYAQAKHILRLLLTTYGLGYDKTFLFTLKDPMKIGEKGFTIKYGTSGLTRKNGSKDGAWHVINYLRKKLTGFHLVSADFDETIKLMRLADGKNAAYIYWFGTNNNNTGIKKIPVEKEYSRASVIALSDFSNGFPPKSLALGSEIEVPVTEFPGLLILEQ